MISRIESVNQQQSSHENQGKEPNEIKELLSKVKLGDLSSIKYFVMIVCRYAGFFPKVSHIASMKQAEKLFISAMNNWTRHQINQLGQFAKSEQQPLESFMKVLRRVVEYSEFGRFHFIPKKVLSNIEELKKKVQEIMIKLLEEVEDCILPKQTNNKLRKNKVVLKNILAQLKLIEPNRFLNEQIFQYLENLLFHKKKMLKQHLQNKLFKGKSQNLQILLTFWEQATILDSIQGDKNKPLFQKYFQQLTKLLKEDMEELEKCSEDFPLFCYVLDRKITKFKNFINLNLEQQFLKPINHFIEVQQLQIQKLGNSFQRGHKMFKKFINFRQRIASYLQINIDQLTLSIAKKSLQGICWTLKRQRQPQVLVKFKKFCREIKDQFGEKYELIEQQRLNVLGMVQKRQEELQKIAANKDKRKNILRERHYQGKPDFDLQAFMEKHQISLFVGKAVLSIYQEDGKILNIPINNSQVIIKQADKQADKKLPISVNDPFKGREVIVIDD